MGYVPSPWLLLFYQLVGHPLSLWGVSFWYLCCTCSNLYTMRVFVGGICSELSSGFVENKKHFDILYIYIYVLLLCCCQACAILWVCCSMLLVCCCCVAVSGMLLLLLLLCCCYAFGMSLQCCMLRCCSAVVLLLLFVKSFFVCHFCNGWNSIFL